MSAVLDVVLYPVSAILWLWHQVFGALFGPASGAAWVLAICFLVFTLRALLLRPALRQLESARRLRALTPELQRVREKHRNSPERLARETRELQEKHGVNPLGSCLLAIAQLPVFLSLVTVLRGFHPDTTGNYVFDTGGVHSFLAADVFGAKLGNWLNQPAAELARFGTDNAHMLAVGVPLLVIAGAATFVSMRFSRRGQQPGVQGAGLLTALSYLAPVGMLVSGLLFPMPIGVLWYFLANNVWTLAQTWFTAPRITSASPEAG